MQLETPEGSGTVFFQTVPRKKGHDIVRNGWSIMKCQAVSPAVAQFLKKVPIGRDAFIHNQVNMKLCACVGEAGKYGHIGGLIALADIVQAKDAMMHGHSAV